MVIELANATLRSMDGARLASATRSGSRRRAATALVAGWRGTRARAGQVRSARTAVAVDRVPSTLARPASRSRRTGSGGPSNRSDRRAGLTDGAGERASVTWREIGCGWRRATSGATVSRCTVSGTTVLGTAASGRTGPVASGPVAGPGRPGHGRFGQHWPGSPRARLTSARSRRTGPGPAAGGSPGWPGAPPGGAPRAQPAAPVVWWAAGRRRLREGLEPRPARRRSATRWRARRPQPGRGTSGRRPSRPSPRRVRRSPRAARRSSRSAWDRGTGRRPLGRTLRTQRSSLLDPVTCDGLRFASRRFSSCVLVLFGHPAPRRLSRGPDGEV